MVKKLFICIIVAAGLLTGRGDIIARTPAVNFGLEWGIDPQIASFHKFNYVSWEGYRVNGDNSGINYNLNATVLANISVNTGEYFRVGLYSGYSGITRNTRVIPLSARFTMFPQGPDKDSFLYFIDAGAGFHLNEPKAPAQKPCFITKLGAGYRYIMGGKTSLDLLVNLRGVVDSPLLKDPDSGGYVIDVRFNSAAYLAVSFSIALNF